MKYLIFALMFSLPALAGLSRDQIGTDYVHQEGDASLMGPEVLSLEEGGSGPDIQREEAQEAAMPDEESEEHKNLNEFQSEEMMITD